VFLILAISARAGELARTPQELVREVAARELAAANAPGHYMYLLHKETKRGSETRAMIQTRNCLVGRVIRVKGKPLTSQQRRQEDNRLAHLLDNRTALLKEESDERGDERRVRDFLEVLPSAFSYTSDGSNISSSEIEWSC